jgi:hypothetical protein
MTTRSSRRFQKGASVSSGAGSLYLRANECAIPATALAAKSMTAKLNDGLCIILNGVEFGAIADSGAVVVAITRPCLDRLGDLGMFNPVSGVNH